MTGRPSPAKGYTLIELMLVVAIVGIVGSIAAWRIDTILPRWRTDALASRFVLDLRQAQAIAARTNRSVQLTVRLDDAVGCTGPSYSIDSDDANYGSVCLATEYPRVSIATAGAHSIAGFGCDYAIPLGSNGCTFCSGGTGTFQILPTGEILRADADANGDALLFAPTDDAAAGVAASVRGVAIRTGTGTARSYRLAKGAWDCT